MFSNELLTEMSKASGMPKYKCKRVLNAIIQVTKDALAHDDKVTLIHVGRLETYMRTEYLAHDPITNERYPVPEHRKVRFVPSVTLKHELNCD